MRETLPTYEGTTVASASADQMENLVNKPTHLQGSSPPRTPRCSEHSSAPAKIMSRASSYLFNGCATYLSSSPSVAVAHGLCCWRSLHLPPAPQEAEGGSACPLPSWLQDVFDLRPAASDQSLLCLEPSWSTFGLLSGAKLVARSECDNGRDREGEKWFLSCPFPCSLEKSVSD